MSKVTDDLEAVRILVETLSNFDADAQERIIRWAREKLGLHAPTPATTPQHVPDAPQHHADHKKLAGHAPNIKTFVAQKKPRTDTQFAAMVAYYYRFEERHDQRKEVIVAHDLQDACRKAGRDRLKNPGQTLRNAVSLGLLDKGQERGTFAINTVGENLVAMTLGANDPQAPSPKRTSRRRSPQKRTKTTPKKSSKRTTAKKSRR